MKKQRTEGGGRKTEDGRRRTEDGGQRTEDRGRKTDDGGQRTEDGRRKTEKIVETVRTGGTVYTDSREKARQKDGGQAQKAQN